MKHLYISLPEKIGRINPDIYGQFSLHMVGGKAPGTMTVRTLHCENPDTVNTFEEPNKVFPAAPVQTEPDRITLPPASVTAVGISLA